MYEITIDVLKYCTRPINFFSLNPGTCHTSILRSAGGGGGGGGEEAVLKTLCCSSTASINAVRFARYPLLCVYRVLAGKKMYIFSE
jgi:hypothetical protein